MEKFCTEEEFLKIVVDGDKEVFDEILSRVFQKGVETAILYIPRAVDALSKRLAYTTKVFKDFMDNHEDFKPYQDIVLKTIQKIEVENPTDTIEEVLKKATPEIEKEIKLLKALKERL